MSGVLESQKKKRCGAVEKQVGTIAHLAELIQFQISGQRLINARVVMLMRLYG